MTRLTDTRCLVEKYFQLNIAALPSLSSGSVNLQKLPLSRKEMLQSSCSSPISRYLIETYLKTGSRSDVAAKRTNLSMGLRDSYFDLPFSLV